ncbi:hypothetical protein V8C35DRAFT_283062 [Trichoderma chlorosporum]
MSSQEYYHQGGYPQQQGGYPPQGYAPQGYPQQPPAVNNPPPNFISISRATSRNDPPCADSDRFTLLNPPERTRQSGSYGPPQGQYGPPQGQYGPPQGQAPMQYEQAPPQNNQRGRGGDQGCLMGCIAALCCCCAVEEGCECCIDLCECFF